MDWDKLRIFHAAAETGSFTRAGEQLNLSQSAISRQIATLEDSLKTTLFNRHARGIVLTEQGELLHRTVRDVFDRIAHVETRLMDLKEMPRGDIKVTAPIGIGSTWLARHVGGFLANYPDIRLQLILTDAELDLSMREADIAIRLHRSTQASLVQRRLMTVHHHLYASREYLSAHGTPSRPEDLDDHTLVVYGPDGPRALRGVNWVVKLGAGKSRREPVMRINNVIGVLRAVEGGAGVAALPDYLAQGSDHLVRLLRHHEGPSFQAYFVYPETMRQSKRVAVFRDFLIGKVATSEF